MCCRWSPSGRQLASGSNDDTLAVWDTADPDPATWAKVATLKAHTDAVNCCEWSPSGRQLASGSDDTTLAVWDTAALVPKEAFGLRSVIRAARTQHRNAALAEALEELDGMVGLADVKLEVAKKVNAKLKTPDHPRTHSNMLCLGPPGTGKSRAAKLIGEIFNACGLVELDAGLPPDARFVEMRTSDLIAGYQGQTPERAAKYLRPHGGKVLFYDEANAFDSAGEACSLSTRRNPPCGFWRPSVTSRCVTAWFVLKLPVRSPVCHPPLLSPLTRCHSPPPPPLLPCPPFHRTNTTTPRNNCTGTRKPPR